MKDKGLQDLRNASPDDDEVVAALVAAQVREAQNLGVQESVRHAL